MLIVFYRRRHRVLIISFTCFFLMLALSHIYHLSSQYFEEQSVPSASLQSQFRHDSSNEKRISNKQNHIQKSVGTNMSNFDWKYPTSEKQNGFHVKNIVRINESVNHSWNKFVGPSDSNKSIKFIIEEKNLCTDDGITLLVVVFVGLNDKIERDFIRTSWGSVAKSNPKVRLMFILGTPTKSSLSLFTVMDGIKAESSIFHDIVQADIVDSYRNLASKSFAFFQWFGTYCNHAKYILKIDCDMRIDLNKLVEILDKSNIPDRLLCGETWRDGYVMRDRNNKWYVSFDTYPNMYYPYYCVGTAYIIPRIIAAKYASFPASEKPFPVDDAYFTGILREKLHEDIEPNFLLNKDPNHYGKTGTRLESGRYIMDVYVRPYRRP